MACWVACWVTCWVTWSAPSNAVTLAVHLGLTVQCRLPWARCFSQAREHYDICRLLRFSETGCGQTGTLRRVTGLLQIANLLQIADLP